MRSPIFKASYVASPSTCRKARRRGGVPKAIIAVLVFLALFGLLRYATMAGPDISVLETRRVSGKDLTGAAIKMEAMKSLLSSEATGGVSGLSGLSAHLRTPPPGKRAATEESDDEPVSQGTEGIEAKIINLEPDANGNFILVRLRLSRDYLEKQGKVKNLLAVVSTPDVQLYSAGTSVEPIFLFNAVRQQTQTDKGTATQFNWGGGNTFTTHETVPAELWLAAGQIKQAQELSSYVEVNCLFSRPRGEGDLTLQVLGTPNISLAAN